MPFSQPSQISTIVQRIQQLNPVSILDVGIGMGQYGFLTRNYLENVNLFCVDGVHGSQRPKHDWRVRIDGIEACTVYLTPVHDYVYNQLLIGDALEILPTMPQGAYDLLLAIDILEHFTTTDGLVFLAQLKRVAGRCALVSTPKEFVPQDVGANPYENHRSLWTQQELVKNGFSEILDNPESWIAVYSVGVPAP